MLFSKLSVATAAAVVLAANAQSDGNPHGWDRSRRCDHTDYSPACGACEGYGGIPTGDANDEITLTTCEIVAQPKEIDPSTLIKPIWGSKWTVPRYYEVDHRELARFKPPTRQHGAQPPTAY